MNTVPAHDSRNDKIVTAVGLLVLLIGTATGNAYAMLAMSLVALVVMSVFLRNGRTRLVLLTLAVAAAIGAGVAVVIAGT